MTFWNVLQNPKLCFKGKWPLIFPLSATCSWLSIGILFKEDPLTPSLVSSVFIRVWQFFSYLYFLEVVIGFETCPIYSFCSILSHPVVEKVAILKAYAKALFTNLISSSALSSRIFVQIPPFFWELYPTQDIRYLFDDSCQYLRKKSLPWLGSSNWAPCCSYFFM